MHKITEAIEALRKGWANDAKELLNMEWSEALRRGDANLVGHLRHAIIKIKHGENLQAQQYLRDILDWEQQKRASSGLLRMNAQKELEVAAPMLQVPQEHPEQPDIQPVSIAPAPAPVVTTAPPADPDQTINDYYQVGFKAGLRAAAAHLRSMLDMTLGYADASDIEGAIRTLRRKAK